LKPCGLICRANLVGIGCCRRDDARERALAGFLRHLREATLQT